MFEDLAGPWRELSNPEAIVVVAPDGGVRSRVNAYFAGTMFIIEDMGVDVRPGDDIRRRLPNGNDEVFRVDDPTYFDDEEFGKHYQVSVSRPSIRPPHEGGAFSVHVSGQNSRVNISSTDNSTNVVQLNPVFNQARELIAQVAMTPEKAEQAKAQIVTMEAAKTQSGFSEAYQKFIAVTADHIAVFGPILSGLALALASLPAS